MAQTKYIYHIKCTKKNSDQTATGDCYTGVLSRAGVSNINVSMEKLVKKQKNNKNPYRNVATKKHQKAEKNFKY